MAAPQNWQVRWQVPFQSLEGINYVVNIYDWAYTGSITTLTGAPQPFVTQENDDSNIFLSVRSQTGYISIILDPSTNPSDATVLNDILPINDRARLVRLMQGSTVKWQGFLQCNMYTQPWEGSAHMIQLPVQSMVAALESIELSPSDTGIKTLAGLLTHGINKLLANDVADADGVAAGLMGNVYLLDDAANHSNAWLRQYIDWRTFIQPKAETEAATTSTRLFGWNFLTIIQAVCTTFGLTLREEGNDIYFTAYDTAQRVWRYPWSTVISIAGGATTGPVTEAIASATLPAALNLRGSINAQTLAQGRKKIAVVLSLQGDNFLMAPTKANGNASALIDVQNMNAMAWGQPHVYVQIHDAINTDTEKDWFFRTTEDAPSPADINTCKECSVLASNNLASQAINAYVTGCFPVRWGYQDSPTIFPKLQPGIFFNQRRLYEGITVYDCFTLSSGVSYTFAGGWLNLDMSVFNFWLGFLSGDSNKWWFGPTRRTGHTMISLLQCSLQFGNKEWKADHTTPINANVAYQDGEWVSIGSGSRFWLIFDNGTLRTNKTADMLADKSTGYFFPIGTKSTKEGTTIYADTEMSGIIELKIYNIQYMWSNLSPQSGGWVTSPSRIVSDLELIHIAKDALGASDKSSNEYRRQTGVPFKGEEEVSLQIGTWNDNINAPNFILESNSVSDYIQALNYTDGSTSTEERPEIHLLGRMVSFYAKSRLWVQAIVDRAMDGLKTIYTYNGRKMVGMNSEIDWENDSKSMKFIEVKDE